MISTRPNLEVEPSSSVLAVLDPPAPLRRSASRPIAETMALFAIGIGLAFTFVLEPSIVPTGSMATTLVGAHVDVQCPACHLDFAVGLDEDDASPGLVCPACGAEGVGFDPALHSGDRLFVHKFAYDLRPPRRWDVIVFQNPEEGGQAYVKRVVGLPREHVLIVDGDIQVNGRIAAKPWPAQEAVRILVYDSAWITPLDDRFPRWRGDVVGRSDLSTAWVQRDHQFFHDVIRDHPDSVDWLHYNHRDPIRRGPGPVRDFLAYNGDLPAEHRVDDLMLDTQIQLGPQTLALHLRIQTRGAQLTFRLPTTQTQPPASLTIDRDGSPSIDTGPIDPTAWSTLRSGDPVRLVVSSFDSQLLILVDGRELVPPLPLEPSTNSTPLNLNQHPVAIGVEGSGVILDRPRIYRDVYYTPLLARRPERAHAVESQVSLAADEYFALGDNSPISLDSRFWSTPAVRERWILGKPLAVYFPGERISTSGGGWVPDYRRIRRIR